MNGRKTHYTLLITYYLQLKFEAVMDRARYIDESMRQLSDVGVYVTLDKDPTNDMIKMVNYIGYKEHMKREL